MFVFILSCALQLESICDLDCVHLMPPVKVFCSTDTIGIIAPSTSLLDPASLLELVELLQFLTRPW